MAPAGTDRLTLRVQEPSAATVAPETAMAGNVGPHDTVDEAQCVPQRRALEPDRVDHLALLAPGGLGPWVAWPFRFLSLPLLAQAAIDDGLGGTELEGKSYFVKAVMAYYVDGRLKEVHTNEVEITVRYLNQGFDHWQLEYHSASEI